LKEFEFDPYTQVGSEVGGETAPICLLPPDIEGRRAAAAGFELRSVGSPARSVRGTYPLRPGAFEGEGELESDSAAALGPLIAAMPSGCSLIAEYRFCGPEVRGRPLHVRLLVQTAPLPGMQAFALARRLCGELDLALRLLSDWYHFEPVGLDLADVTRRARLQLRCTTRRVMAPPPSHVGFIAADDQKHRLVLHLPRTRRLRSTGAEGAASLLRGSGRSVLFATLRAARACEQPLVLRLGLRRRDLSTQELASLDTLAGKVVPSNGESGQSPWAAAMAQDAARRAADQLLAQPEACELFIECDRTDPGVTAMLRIAGEELLPEFVTDVVEPEPAPGDEATLNLGQIVSPSAHGLPLLPSPVLLKAMGFPRHHDNPMFHFPSEGTLLGRAQVGRRIVDVRLPQSGRSRHTLVIGQSGTGKSTLLFNMAVQDMRSGMGLIVLDPHGDMHEELVRAVPAGRRRDLIVIDPEDERVIHCLNPLDRDAGIAATQRVASDLLEVFAEIYDMKTAGGPLFEDSFRHAILAAAAAPSSSPEAPAGSAPDLATVTHLLRDAAFRQRCVEAMPSVYGVEAARPLQRFFASAEATRGEHAFPNLVLYLSSKLTRIVNHPTMARMFCSGPRTLDFRSAMDRRAIVLANLGKGSLGTADMRFIGMLLVRSVLAAALSRCDLPREQRVPCGLYLDEFQNFVSASAGVVPEMLSESRKYGLHLVLASQTLGQLRRGAAQQVIDAVLGNVASQVFLRLGTQEAEFIEPLLRPQFDADTLRHLPDRHAVCRLQIEGRPSPAFVMQTLPPLEPDPELAGAVCRHGHVGTGESNGATAH
jgi:hypothetical protein